MGAFIDKLLNWFRTAVIWIAGIYALLLSFGTWLMQQLLSMAETVYDTIVVVVGGVSGNLGGVGDASGMNENPNMLVLINTLIPLEEAGALAFVFALFMSGITIIRWTKSVIPTVSN